jgi:hypothetical protein
MHEANFELIEIPHVRQSGKNSADIRLVVDALDLCYTKSHVNTFVIISGDSDFSPLVSKLRENNKQVIGVGVKESTSDLLIANCDEFIFYDDLVRESGRQSSRREARPAPPASRRPAPPSANPEDDRRRDEAENRKNKAVELALQTFEALYAERGDGGKIWASVLKEAIKRRKPDFSESYYGFRSFGGLLEEMQARGFLKMGRDEKSNAFVFRSGGSDVASAGSNGAEPAPAAPEVLPLTHRAGAAEAREPRGRGARTRGGRRNAPERHDFEAPVVAEAAQASLPYAAEEDDDAAERFADAARESQAARGVNPPGEPAPDADTYVTDEAATDHDGEAAPRDSGRRRGGRGGRGNPARKNAGQAAPVERAPEAPAPAPVAEPPAAAEAPAPAAVKTPRARKTPAAKAASAEKKPAAKKAAARPARKTKAAGDA